MYVPIQKCVCLSKSVCAYPKVMLNGPDAWGPRLGLEPQILKRGLGHLRVGLSPTTLHPMRHFETVAKRTKTCLDQIGCGIDT